MQEDNLEENKNERRDFLRKSLLGGSVLAAGAIGLNQFFAGEKIKVVSPEGKVYEASSDHLKEFHPAPVTNNEARKGIAGQKFVMVIE